MVLLYLLLLLLVLLGLLLRHVIRGEGSLVCRWLVVMRMVEPGLLLVGQPGHNNIRHGHVRERGLSFRIGVGLRRAEDCWVLGGR